MVVCETSQGTEKSRACKSPSSGKGKEKSGPAWDQKKDPVASVSERKKNKRGKRGGGQWWLIVVALGQDGGERGRG